MNARSDRYVRSRQLQLRPFLARAVQSLLNQTLREIEVIVVDDASTDETPQVLAHLAADPRVRVVNHEVRRGNRYSDHEGTMLARAEFVGTLDADDFCLDHDAVRRQIAMLEAHPDLGFVYTAYRFVDEDERHVRVYQPWPADYVRDGLAEFADLVKASHISHSGTIVRRACYTAIGGNDPALPYAGDLDLWLRLSANYQVGYLAEPMYAYRLHRGSMTSDGLARGQALDEMLRAVEKGFAALPAEARDRLRPLHAVAIRRQLLAMTWGMRSLGRTRRSWHELAAAVRRAPNLVITRDFYGALSRLFVLSVVGHHRYEALVNFAHGRRLIAASRRTADTQDQGAGARV